MEISNLTQLRKIVKENSKRGIVQQAVNHENRIKFHVETEVANNTYNPDANEFLSWVKSLLPLDKYTTFINLFKYPVSTNDVTEKIFNSLERVFEAKNPFVNYEFTNPELRMDWDNYRSNVLDEKTVWRTYGWQNYKVSINSVLIIDLPKEQEGDRPEPYFYWLDISCVDQYKLKQNGVEFEYIIFKYKGKDDVYAVFDDKYYRIVEVEGTEFNIKLEEEHNLGYVPARFFWTTPLKKSQPDLKRSDLSNQLTSLDDLLFRIISKAHLDLYASYPIYSGISADCDYVMTFGEGENSYTDECDRGFIRRDGNYVSAGNSLLKCPACSEKRLSGAGSYIEYDPPTEMNGNRDLSSPVQITSVDTDSLEYNRDEVVRIRQNIITNVIGLGGEPDNNQAVNEKQIMASFEERTTVLQKIAWNFENAQKFVNDTICRLRYGDAYIGSEISWGKDFYIYTSNELREIYKMAKENGFNNADLDMIQDQIISTEHRNNPSELKRAEIMNDLEPYRHLTLDEVIELKKEGLILDNDDLQLKLNFANFIDRFERENMSIVDFGEALEYNKKINIIKESLKSYGKTGKED